MTTKEKKGTETPTKGKEIEVTRPSRFPDPFSETDRWFDNLFPRGWMRPFHRNWPDFGEMASAFETRMPKVDIIDRDDEIIVHAEVPGVQKDDLDVSVSDHTVTIKGKTKREKKEEKGDYYRSELYQGSFARTVTLPSEVDSDKVKANFKDGVLELKMPKIAQSKRRSVKID